jgi:hypothetical protein
MLSHLVEGAGLLKSTQAVDDGAEKPEKDQRTILIHMQVAIACLVSLRPLFIPPFRSPTGLDHLALPAK